MSSSPDYAPPTVWTGNKANGGQFANINRPISGPTHEAHQRREQAPAVLSVGY